MKSEQQVHKAAAALVEHQRVLAALSTTEGSWLIGNTTLALALFVHHIRHMKELHERPRGVDERQVRDLIRGRIDMKELVLMLFPGTRIETDPGSQTFRLQCPFHNVGSCSGRAAIFESSTWRSDCPHLRTSRGDGFDLIMEVFSIDFVTAATYLGIVMPGWACRSTK